MNILIFSWRGPKHPNAGGAEISTYEHAKGWVKAGHRVTLFTSYFDGVKNEEIIDGIKIKRYGSQIFGVQWSVFKWYLFNNHIKYDLVVDEFHGIPFFTPLYIREKKLALIHEVTKEVWSLNPWLPPFNLIPAFFGSLFEPFIFRLFYRNIPFMTGSNSTKKDLVVWGIPQSNITVIPYGFNPLKFKIPHKEKKKTLIFLGALSKDKGIEDALKVFSILNKGGYEFQYWIAGKGERYYMEKLKSQSIKLGIDGKVKFWGYISERLKFELLARAHLLVNPSIREGWGLVVIEAASVGTPTVGYNVSGLKDSIQDNKTGILTECTPYSCASAILTLVQDENKYKILRQNCFRWARMFDWVTSVKKSLALLDNIKNKS